MSPYEDSPKITAKNVESNSRDRFKIVMQGQCFSTFFPSNSFIEKLNSEQLYYLSILTQK